MHFSSAAVIALFVAVAASAASAAAPARAASSRSDCADSLPLPLCLTLTNGGSADCGAIVATQCASTCGACKEVKLRIKKGQRMVNMWIKSWKSEVK